MDKAREYEKDLEKRAAKLEDQFVLGQVDTTDTNARYLGSSRRLLAWQASFAVS